MGDAGTIEYNGQDEKEKIEEWPFEDVVDISAGYYLTMALSEPGEVYVAGNEYQGQMEANNWDYIKVIHDESEIGLK